MQNGLFHFFLPWVVSNSVVRPGPPSLACHQQKEYTEKTIVYCGSDYHTYTYSFSPKDPIDSTLAQTCGYLHQSCQVWHQLWHQYAVPISPKSVRRLLSPICHSSYVPPPIICCRSGRLGVWCIHIQKLRLVDIGIGVCCNDKALFYASKSMTYI